MSTLSTLRPKGNALVPDDASILPPQAYVNDMPSVAAAYAKFNYEGPQYLSLASHGITYFDKSFATALSGGSLAGNALTAANVDDILNEFVLATISEGLDLAGGTNGVPTAQQIRILGRARVQIADGQYPTDVKFLRIYGNTIFGLEVAFVESWNFADSTGIASGFNIDSSANNIAIGIQDTPTLSQINAFIANEIGNGGVIVMNNDADLPLFNASNAGFMVDDFISGQPFMANTSVLAIAAGYSATVNEYVNRAGPRITLSGAGSSVVNVTAQRAGIYGAKSYYLVNGYQPQIKWETNKWVIEHGGAVLYQSFDNTMEPWDAVFVPFGTGLAPAPIISLVAGTADVEPITYAP